MTYLEALKTAAIGNVTMLFQRDVWQEIKRGIDHLAWGLFTLLVRLIVCLLYPISTPVLAYLMVLDYKITQRKVQEARERVRREANQLWKKPHAADYD